MNTMRMAVLALAALGSAAAQARTYTAEYSWEMETKPDSCAVRREFGTGSDVVLLELRQYLRDGDVRAMVAGTELKIARQLDPLVHLPPHAGMLKPDGFFRIAVPNGPQGLIFTLPIMGNEVEDPRFSSQPGLKDATQLELTSAFSSDISLETGPMTDAIAFLEGCTQQLIRSWGLDPDEQKALSRRPTPVDQKRWAAEIQRAFPTRPLLAGESGRVNFRLLIDDEGTPTDCFVEPPAIPELQETACKLLMKHARFEPGLDSAGQPVASYFVSTVVYLVTRGVGP